MKMDNSEFSFYEKIIIDSLLYRAINEIGLLGSILCRKRSQNVKENRTDSIIVTTQAAEIKIEQERSFIEDSLVSIRKEFSDSYKWNNLINILNQLRGESENQCILLKRDLDVLNYEWNELTQNMSEIEKHYQVRTKMMDVGISLLKDDLEDVNFQQQVEAKYIEKWESARTNQGVILAEMEERRLKDKLEMLTNRMDNEERVHLEMSDYLELSARKLQDEINTWKENYKQKMSYYSEELQVTKEKRELQLRKLRSLNKKFYEHKNKIKEYIEQKKERERVKAEQQHLNDMATKIQAWWRGVMVRRHLGPYKKKGKTKEKPKFKCKSFTKPEQNQEKDKPKGK